MSSSSRAGMVLGGAIAAVGVLWLLMRGKKEAEPEEEIWFAMNVTNFPERLQPITRWYLTWRGQPWGKWSIISEHGVEPIRVGEVPLTPIGFPEGSGRLVIYLDTAAIAIHKIDLGNQTLQAGGLYAYDVTTGEIHKWTGP